MYLCKNLIQTGMEEYIGFMHPIYEDAIVKIMEELCKEAKREDLMALLQKASSEVERRKCQRDRWQSKASEQYWKHIRYC